ncbi:hypothetical protein K1719_047052 [Acacia pycnantha]|nr:hypothetical protein K1719_047052 [Acacia pycnantha]
MAHHHRSQFGDTTFTKVFVGGLAWETPADEMRRYFEQFGRILEAVIINDKHTGKSKGYGFVTFRDPDSARKACADPKPMIYGRRANCNIASLGRPPSPRGTNISVQDGGKQVTEREKPEAYYNGVPAAAAPPSPMYSAAYSYPTYTTDYGFHQAQYYQQFYGQSYSYYGYCVQTPRPRAALPSAGASYPYYPTYTPMEGYCPPLSFLSPTDSRTQQRSSLETTAGVGITSESANSQGKN